MEHNYESDAVVVFKPNGKRTWNTTEHAWRTHLHNWIAPKKKETAAGASTIKKQLTELFPNMKADELEVMAAITTKKERDAYITAHGNDK
jgi:hypothetical protein